MHRSQMRKSWMALALASTLAVSLSLGVGAEDGQADQSLPAMTIGYQSGMITAVHETNFEIDGRAYGFTLDAVIVDEEGNPMEPSSVLLKAAVKFHVKNEQRDKIDRMILVLPK
ncbi:MAG: hypothetical protein H8K08_02300 [Nitrospira sp.]|nr:hypothetical protein [Nitrospira sp.]